MNQKHLLPKIELERYFLWLVPQFFLPIVIMFSPSVFAQTSVSTSGKNGDIFSAKKIKGNSPEWRLQMSEIFIDNSKETQALWDFGIKELRESEPTLDTTDWERYAIQKLVVNDIEFFIFKWISNVREELGEMPGDLPIFGGSTHWFLLSKKANQVVYKKKFDDEDEYSMPATAENFSDVKHYTESKDLAWKQQCKKTVFRKNNNASSLHYRECPAFARVVSNGGETILLSVFMMSEQSNSYFSFDPLTAQLTSIVEFSGKNSYDVLGFDPLKKILYLESKGMNLTLTNTVNSLSLRQKEAAIAFSKSKLGVNYPRLRPCISNSCTFDLQSIPRRIDLENTAKFQENWDAKLSVNFIEENNSLYLSVSKDLNNRISELEKESWEFRASWLNSYLGAFAAVNEPQRIIKAWGRISLNMRKDIDPSDIALYWASVGAEGLLRAFPSPLLNSHY